MSVFKWLGRASERRPWLVIGVITLTSVVMVIGTMRIKSNFDFKSMLPPHADSVKALNDVNAIFGGTNEERIVLEQDNVIDPVLLKQVEDYQAALQSETQLWDSFATRVTTPFDNMKQFTPEAMQLLSTGSVLALAALQGQTFPTLNAADLPADALVEQVNANLRYNILAEQAGGMAAQSNITPDHHAMLLSVSVNPDLTNQKEQSKYVKRFRSFTQDYFARAGSPDVYTGGNISSSVESMEDTQRESMFLFSLAFLFILLILFLTFRRVSDVALTLLVILVTVLWVQGMSGWLNIPFTFTSTALMPLLLGIDIAYAIHVLSRYYEERRKGGDPFQSAFTSVGTVGVAVFLTAATTAFGFASFGISSMPPIQQFGLLCVLGVMFAFFLSVTLLPASLVLRDRSEKAQAKWKAKQEKRRKQDGESWVDRGLVKVAVLAEHHRLLVGIVTVVVLGFSVFMALQLGTSMDLKAMRGSGTPASQALDKVNEYFGGQDQAITLLKGDIFNPQVLGAMLAYENGLGEDSPTDRDGAPIFERSKVVSVADIMAQMPGGLPQTEEQAKMAFQGLKASGMDLSGLVGSDGSAALIVARVPLTDDKDMEKAAVFMRQESSLITEGNSGLTVANTGVPVLVNDIMGNLVPTQLKTSLLALILCAAIVILVFSSVTFGLAAASVVFIGILLELGSLRLFGWSLDFMTVMISSLVIGAGIDFGIHVTHRFREEWHHGGVDVHEAVRLTIANVGKALLAAAVTTAGAFAIIAFSSQSFLRRFGLITALSLTFALIGALVVLPSGLAWLAQRSDRKKGRFQPAE